MIAYKKPQTPRFNDAEIHPNGFDGDFVDLQDLLRTMDENNVGRAWLPVLPYKVTWHRSEKTRPTYYTAGGPCMLWTAADWRFLDALERLPDHQRSRFVPLPSGFSIFDLGAVDDLRRIYDRFPWIGGVGEILCKHDLLTARCGSAVPTADHPALMKVYRWAGEMGLPVLLHNNVTCPGGMAPDYLDEVRRALAGNPDTRLVWAHAGVSRGVCLPNHPGVIRRMLREHENLWINLSWTVLFEQALTHRDGSFDPRWLDLIGEFPDRFLCGTDSVGPQGLDEYGDTLSYHHRLFEALGDREVVERIAYRNFDELTPSLEPAAERAYATGRTPVETSEVIDTARWYCLDNSAL